MKLADVASGLLSTYILMFFGWLITCLPVCAPLYLSLCLTFCLRCHLCLHRSLSVPPTSQHLVSYLSHAVPLIPALSYWLLYSLLWLVYLFFLAFSFLYLLWIPTYFCWTVSYISHLVPFCFFSTLPDTLPSDPLQSQYDSWLSLVDHLNIKAFVNLTLADSVRHGIQHLLFISGLGQCHHLHHKMCLLVNKDIGKPTLISGITAADSWKLKLSYDWRFLSFISTKIVIKATMWSILCYVSTNFCL